jgi:hypothetical protein
MMSANNMMSACERLGSFGAHPEGVRLQDLRVACVRKQGEDVCEDADIPNSLRHLDGRSLDAFIKWLLQRREDMLPLGVTEERRSSSNCGGLLLRCSSAENRQGKRGFSHQ